MLRSLLLAALLVPTTQADVIISNFGSAVGVGTAFGGGATTQFKAFGFRMGNEAYRLDEVVLSMNFTVAAPNPVVSIWSDANGPAIQLFTLTNPAALSGNLDFTFTATSAFTLEADTNYWLHVVSNPTNGPAFTWQGTSPSSDPTGIASSLGFNFNGNVSVTRNRLEVRGTRTGIGTSYCAPAIANSTGASATIAASGSTVAAANNVTLTAAQLPNNSFGFFLTSRTQGAVNQPGGSQGVLCLGGAIGRYVGPGQIKNSGTTGSFALAINLANTPTPTGPVAAVAGETWRFQAWYRDAVGGSATSNFTDGVALTFQ